MNNKQRYIRQLFKRWISGDIRATGEQRLDAAAQEDPFLAEALKGLRASADIDHAQSIDRIRQQLGAKKKKRIFTLFPMLRVAAVVALLIVVGGVLWLGPGFNQASDMAMKTTAPKMEMAPTVTLEEEDAFEQEESTSPVSVEGKNILETKQQFPTSNAVDEKQRTKATKPEATALKDDSPAPDSPKRNTTASKKNTIASNNVDQPVLAAPSEYIARTEPNELEEAVTVEPADDAAISKEAATMPSVSAFDRDMTSNMGFPVAKEGFRVIEGTVTDHEGYPLIGASILEVGTSNGTLSDLDGYFTITVSAGDGVQLDCSYTGYLTERIGINDQDTYSIALGEAIALNEVVVLGRGIRRSQKSNAYSLSRNESAEDNTRVEDVQPVLGFKAFKDYIRQNTPENSERAKVRLRFSIDINGRPINITVLHSTNDHMNTLAMQLIETGPNWIVNNGESPIVVEYQVKIR